MWYVMRAMASVLSASLVLAAVIVTAQAWETTVPRRFLSLNATGVEGQGFESISRRQAIATGAKAAAGCNIYDGQFVFDKTNRPAYDNKNCPYFDVSDSHSLGNR